MASSVGQALRRAAQVNPDGAACITHRGPDRALATTSYAALAQTTDAIADALQSHLQSPTAVPASQPRLALLCRNHELALAYLFAAADAGWAAAPLNTRWAAPEAAAALVDCDPAVIACDADLSPLLHAALAHAQASTAGTTALPSLRAVVTLYGDEPTSSSSSSSSHQPAPVKCLSHEAWLRHRSSGSGMVGQRCDDEDAVQCLVYTSGSTGEPKGVMLSHKAQMIQAQEKVELGRYDASTTYLSLAPLFHVAGLNSSIAVTLAGGTHVFLQPPGGPRGLGPPPLALAAAAVHGVNTLVLVPAMLSALLDACDAAESAAAAQAAAVRASVRFVLVGGQPLTEPLWRRTAAALPHARVVQSYACSEACSSITFLELQPNAPFPAPGLVGRAARPVEVAILALPDDDYAAGNDEKRPGSVEREQWHRFVREPGRTGEIATRGPHLMRGYWRRPAATAAALVAVEGEEGGKGLWLRTGDVGRLDAEGRVWFQGRTADVIRSGAEKVMAVEVERALLAHPAVALAAAVGRPDPVLGERVVALVVLRPGGGVVEPEALRRFCRGRLAGYKVPKEVRFVAALPVTASGKVMKARVKAQLALLEEREGEQGPGRQRSFL